MLLIISILQNIKTIGIFHNFRFSTSNLHKEVEIFDYYNSGIIWLRNLDHK